MSLLNPLLFALGAAALVVPLWVHLRLGKVKKRAVVGSLRLLQASPQTSRRPRRLIKLPLLLLRCLITLLIALGFARLLAPWLGQDASEESTAIVLDASGSMQAKNGTRTSWELAREAALAHLDRLAPSARVAVIVSPPQGNKPAWTDPGTARAAIRALRPGWAANQLHADILTAVAELKTMPDDQPKKLHVISDFQRSSFVGIDQAAIPGNVQLELTKTSPEKPSNRGVAVTVTRAGASNLRLYAFNDATPGTITLFENNSSKATPFAAGRLLAAPPSPLGSDGSIQRKLRINEADDLAADDTAWDHFRPQQEIPVWLWQDQPSRKAERSVTESPAYFLSRALQPSENPADGVSLFRPRAVSAADLADAKLPPLLLVPACETYPETLVSAAKSITSSGGSVVFFGGDHLNARALEAFGGLAPVIPDGIEKVPSTPALALIGRDHPLFGSLSEEARLRLANSPLLRRHVLTPKPGARTLARFADAKIFIIESGAGSGKSYFINTSANREFGDWPADAPRFIPAVHLLMARAVEGKFHRPDDAPAIAGEPYQPEPDPKLAGKTVVIEGARHTVAADGSIPAVTFTEPGIKSILADGKVVRQVAVNFPPAESALDNLTETVVRQRLESQRRHDGGASVRWENTANGQLAWQSCILLGSLLLLVEPLIADRKNLR